MDRTRKLFVCGLILYCVFVGIILIEGTTRPPQQFKSLSLDDASLFCALKNGTMKINASGYSCLTKEFIFDQSELFRLIGK